MLQKIVLTVALLAPIGSFALIYDDDLELLQRGDANNDGGVDISDVTTLNSWLFLGGNEPPCLNQADVNNDGDIDLTDSVFLSNWLFNYGPAPEPPAFPSGSGPCGVDDNPIGCQVSPCDL